METAQHFIAWVEIPVTDLARAKHFYEQVFETTTNELQLANGLVMAMFPWKKGIVTGALCFNRQAYTPSGDGVLVYLNAEPDIQAVIDRITAAGGTILLQRTKISEEWGYMALFIDSEGNRIALHASR
jgi:predicted enzyme related to lactoylglutathione lyase